MAGTKLVGVGLDATRYLRIVDYPIPTNLTSLFYIGTDEASSVVNEGSTADGTVGVTEANITYQTGYATFAGIHTTAGNFINTSDQDNASTNVTLAALFRKTDANFRAVWGTWNQGIEGITLTTTGFSAGEGAGLKTANYEYTAEDEWIFQAGVYDGSKLNVYTGFEDDLLLGTPTACVRQTATKVARIGGGHSLASTGVVDIAAVSKHTSALNIAQVKQIYLYFKQRAELLGLTVK